MLSATSNRELLGSTLGSTVFLERRLRAHLVTRDRLLYDSAYAPPAKKPSSVVHLYATLRGTFSPAPPRLARRDGSERPELPAVDGPVAYVLDESEFDRVESGARTFRSFGPPGVVGVILELRVAAADLHAPAGIEHGPLPLPDFVWDAYAALEAAPSAATLHELIVRLGEARIVSRDLATSVVAAEPDRFVRVWTVMQPLYQDLATSTSLKQIATIAGLSLRQLGRDLGELTRTFGLFGAGFRDAMRLLRLRAACLFLSAPGASPSDVARAVGYGSLDAMGRAFRDASLPAPSIVQAAVRYPSR